jgi:monofunctional biosynthetic peptidoglycan transglycosylase
MKTKGGKIKRILKYMFVYLPALFFLFSIFWIVVLKWVPVYVTPLMVIRSVEYIGDDNFDTRKSWRSLDKISKNMVMAVIASEDNKFMEHNGFDWEAIDKAIDYNKRGRKIRGASTISQQTAKNVFLFPSRTWLRKGLEAYFTFGIELVWGKERIMEVYLNVAEMGRGIYGAEAAARELFGKPASSLSEREAALIAAALPNPMRRNAGNPSGYLSYRASRIQSLMYKVDVPEFVKNRKVKKKN